MPNVLSDNQAMAELTKRKAMAISSQQKPKLADMYQLLADRHVQANQLAFARLCADGDIGEERVRELCVWDGVMRLLDFIREHESEVLRIGVKHEPKGRTYERR